MDLFAAQRENHKQLLSMFDEIKQVGMLCDPLYQKYGEIEVAKRNASAKNPTAAVVGLVLGAGSALVWLWPLAIGNVDTAGMVLFWVLVEAVSAGLILISLKAYKKIKLAQRGASIEIERMNEYQAEILDEIDRIYRESTIASIYPQKYLFLDAIEYCYTLINDMRADSIKEAINLYEDIMYKERIEKSQRETAQILRSIENETSKARKAAQFAAVASGVSAYYTRKTHKAFQRYTK